LEDLSTQSHRIAQCNERPLDCEYNELRVDWRAASASSTTRIIRSGYPVPPYAGRLASFPAPFAIACNADIRIAEVRKFCKLDETGVSLMRSAMSQMNLSARAYHRILKLACTIADLAGNETILPPHLAEALQYRPKLMI
jgi:hypothetical protein